MTPAAATPSASGLRRRALLAVALWAGFPVLGLALTGAFLFLPWTELATGSLEPFGIASGVCALVVAWSMRPRFTTFVAPGPLVTAKDYPALWALLADLAGRVGDRIPEEVYLLGEANAFVGSRRRGLRRVSTLGIGLPMLLDLDQSALRAILAHEYGHRHAGDTRLGPWFHSTGRSIGATVERLQSDGGLLQLPFVSYGNLFVDVTRALSRQQEFAADQLSARLCGGSVAQAGLRWAQTRGRLWDAYWHGDVLPLLRQGVRAPILEGWRLYLSGERVQEALDALASNVEEKADPWDTHPPTHERLAALEGCEDLPQRREDHAAAIELIGDAERVFDKIFREMLIDPEKPLRVLSWPETAREVWLPLWRRELAGLPKLQAFRPQELPRMVSQVDDLVGSVRTGVRIMSPEAERRQVLRSLSLQVGITLADAGCEPDVGPGIRLVLRRGSAVVAPLEVVAELKSGRLTAEAWTATCEAMGV